MGSMILSGDFGSLCEEKVWKLCEGKNCLKSNFQGIGKAEFFCEKRILNCPKTDDFDSLFIPAHSFSSESVVSLRVFC